MNCTHWQRKVLLAQSGELADAERAALDEHAASCPECRAFRGAAEDIAARARSTRPVEPDRALDLAPIRAEAGRLASSGRLLRFARPYAAPVAACAAAALLAAGIWFMASPDRKAAAPFHDVGALMSMVSEAHNGTVSIPAQGDESARVQALAKEILRMEGLSADEVL